MEILVNEKKEAIRKINEIVSQGGPLPHAYGQFESHLETVAALLKAGEIDAGEVTQLINSCEFLSDTRSIMGHIRQKPHGYAGDYEIIDRLYQENILSDAHKKWDLYALQHPAAAAVRNRKAYFKALVSAKTADGNPLNMLNVASGPARDLLEVFKTINAPEKLKVSCVEMDRNAIAHAKSVTSEYSKQVSFIHKNIFRFSTDEKYDLIWSAGLFDYFSDESFIRLIRNFKNWGNPGGEIVIGNFNAEHNPSRYFMEMFGEWHLNHRSAKELSVLAQKAGFAPSCIGVGTEPENINLFLHLHIL